MHRSTTPIPRIPSTRLRWTLGGSAAILLAVGIPIFLNPLGYQEDLGVTLPQTPTLLSDMRAQAGALLGVASLLLAGATFRPQLAKTAAVSGAVLYLSYGLSRLASMALDGMPASVLVGATVLELAVGTVLALSVRPGSPPAPAPASDQGLANRSVRTSRSAPGRA